MAGVLYLCEKSNANAMRSSVDYAPHCDDFVGRAFGGRSSPPESFSLMSFWLGRDSDPDYNQKGTKEGGAMYYCDLGKGYGFTDVMSKRWEEPGDCWEGSPSESFTLYSSWVGSALLEKANASIPAPISNPYAYLEQD